MWDFFGLLSTQIIRDNTKHTLKTTEVIMTIGLRLKIKESAIKKEWIFKGKKGNYLDLTVFVNEEEDQYGNNGGIFYQKDKESDKVFIGNAKIFWSDEPSGSGQKQSAPAPGHPADEDDDIPF